MEEQHTGRIIKFRTWDNKHNKLVDHKYLEHNRGGFRMLNGTEFTFMQFTGLTDKNGKEIYEGDVIEFRNIDSGMPSLRLPVVWDKAACGFHFDDGNNQRGVDMASGYDTISGEVIGNIYEIGYGLPPLRTGSQRPAL